MNPACVNLREKFGRRFRIAIEESYYADTGNQNRVKVDPWLLIIPCKYGHIFPWGGDRIAVSVDGHTRIARRLRRLKCVRIEQDGDFGELTASFTIDDFDAVAEMVQPRRKRQPTPNQLKQLARMRQRALLNRNSQLTDARSRSASMSDTTQHDFGR